MPSGPSYQVNQELPWKLICKVLMSGASIDVSGVRNPRASSVVLIQLNPTSIVHPLNLGGLSDRSLLCFDIDQFCMEMDDAMCQTGKGLV